MADFHKALPRVLKFEGGVSDIHGEGFTTFGIDQSRNEDWEGWEIVNKYKEKTTDYTNTGELYRLLKEDSTFMNLVAKIYKERYWDVVMADMISSQDVAYNIFDFAVNSGPPVATTHAQEVVGLNIDGVMNIETVEAINNYDVENFIFEYKNLRIKFYHSIASQNPSKERFLSGWLKRVSQC